VHAEDPHGNRAPAAGASLVFASDPTFGVDVYSDPGCAAPATGVSLDHEISVFIRATPGWATRRRLLIREGNGELEAADLPLEVVP
jgi:hypothetical protein